MFHFLVDEVCCAQIGTQNAQKEHRYALARAFVHTSMKDACVSFAGGTLKDSIIKGLPRDANGNYPIPIQIRNLAGTFVELQEKRHLADYDLSERFQKVEVLRLIEQAELHVDAFRQLAASDTAQVFSCLSLGFQRNSESIRNLPLPTHKNKLGAGDLILNTPFVEPEKYWSYDRKHMIFTRMDGRRPAGYIVATPDAQGFNDPGQFVVLDLVNKIRRV